MPLISGLAIAISTVIGLTAAIILFCLFKRREQRKYHDFVLENSISIKKLDEINRRYDFYPYVCFDQFHTYDNQAFFNMISCKDYLIYQLQYIRTKLFEQIKKVDHNSSRYKEYLAEVNSIDTSGQFAAPIGKLKSERLLKTECKLMQDKTCVPVTQFCLKVTLYRSNINGRVCEEKGEIFTAEDIFAINKRLNRKSGNFYLDREIWESICRVERGKVSNKMRFAIYKRDGYRCCKCGVSDRYAPLEIDHIIPIAKGGKSTYDNLQTLCHRCNTKKGDTIE